MSKEIDIEIYKHISNEMDVSEIYLGHIAFAFHYTKAQYSATCTEAFPFNPFDKVICELLKTEEHLSFENIGDILGMNVYKSENPKHYLDLAEKEILTEALQSLASDDFKMIVGGDINFSRCRLTTIGREYAEKKSKYRITENKPFNIFFDHTTGNHLQAKQFFEFVDGKLSGKEFAIELTDEAALKEIAAVQIPEIYNPAKQYSFTNAVLNQQKNLSVEFPIAVTFNIKEDLYRFYCYDTANKNIHKHFNDWINSKDSVSQDLLNRFKEENTTIAASQENFLQIYTEQIATFSATTKIDSVKSSLLKKDFIDEHLFLSSFHELFLPAERIELYLCFPRVTESIAKAIRTIILKCENSESRFFFIFPNRISEKIQTEFSQLKQLSNKGANLYIIQQDVKSFSFFYKTEAESSYFDITAGSINNLFKRFFQKKIWDKRIDKIKLHFLEKFSDQYALQICEEVTDLINSKMDKTVTKKELEDLKFYESKLEPFSNISTQGETVELTLELIETFREERIEKLEEKLNSQFNEIESQLTTVIDENEFSEIQKVFATTTAEIIVNDSEVFKRSEILKISFAKKKEEFAEAKRFYWFIIDTNSFMKDPEIIQKIQAKNRVVIAAKVLDELDKHKANSIHKEAASKVIREIFADRNKNIHRAKANLRLLPPDFNKKSSDNIILATALMYKDRNGILISDDKGLHEKAKSVEMQIMTYSDFISIFINSKK